MSEKIANKSVKKGDKLPSAKSSHPWPRNYVFMQRFSSEVCKILSKPILNALKERKQTKQAFINEINLKGFNYSYSGFINVLKGENIYINNFGYFSRLYEYLDLPFPSLEYLNSFD
jgi:hypothetical protein